MKKTPILLFLLVAVNVSFSQDILQVFLSSNYFPVDSLNSKYVRYMKNVHDNLFDFQDYHLSGELHQEGQILVDFKNFNYGYKSKKGDQIYKFTYDGMLTVYYKNGNIQSKGNYENGRKNGIFQEWYENGNKESDFLYNDKMEAGQEPFLMNYYDSLGSQLVNEGEGIYIKYKENQLLDSGRISKGMKEDLWKGSFVYGKYSEKYLNGKLIEGVSYDSLNNKYEYKQIMVQPEYRNGMESFYRLIFTNLKYPVDARRYGVQGIVYVQFVVDKTGNITEVQTVRGIGECCDREAERVVSMGKGFKPGFVRGQPAKIRMILPITFKLG